VRVKTALGELTRHLHRVYPLEISQRYALLLIHEEKNPTLTGGMEIKPAGVEKHMSYDVTETVKTRSGRGAIKPTRYCGLVELESAYNTAIAGLNEYLKQSREWLKRLVQKL